MQNVKINSDKIYEGLQAVLKEEVNEKGNYRRRLYIQDLAKVTVLAVLRFLNEFIYHQPVSKVKCTVAY